MYNKTHLYYVWWIALVQHFIRNIFVFVNIFHSFMVREFSNNPARGIIFRLFAERSRVSLP